MKIYDVCSVQIEEVLLISIKLIKQAIKIKASVETNLIFERIRIPNLIRNPEIFRIRILFVVRPA